MKTGNLVCQLVDVPSRQLTVGLQCAQQAILRELFHLERVFDGFAIATQLRRVRCTGDRQNLEVEVFGQTLIQAQLFLAEMLAQSQGGEIQKAEVHRFFEFVGIRTRQQHPGNVRFDDLETLHRMGEEGRVLQGSNQRLAHGRSFRNVFKM